jgi:hypothetical protein
VACRIIMIKRVPSRLTVLASPSHISPLLQSVPDHCDATLRSRRQPCPQQRRAAQELVPPRSIAVVWLSTPILWQLAPALPVRYLRVSSGEYMLRQPRIAAVFVFLGHERIDTDGHHARACAIRAATAVVSSEEYERGLDGAAQRACHHQLKRREPLIFGEQLARRSHLGSACGVQLHQPWKITLSGGV